MISDWSREEEKKREDIMLLRDLPLPLVELLQQTTNWKYFSYFSQKQVLTFHATVSGENKNILKCLLLIFFLSFFYSERSNFESCADTKLRSEFTRDVILRSISFMCNDEKKERTKYGALRHPYFYRSNLNSHRARSLCFRTFFLFFFLIISKTEYDL